MARKESRVPGEPMVTTVGQTGILGDVVDAVRRAWVLIHEESPQWRFLQAYKQVSLIPEQEVYTLSDLEISDARGIDKFLVLRQPLIQKTEQDFILSRMYEVRGTPRYYAVTHDGRIRLAPVPTETDAAEIFYIRKVPSPQSNEATPMFGAEYHPIIAWMAVQDLAMNESDGVIYQKAAEHHDRLRSLMYVAYLPPVLIAPGVNFHV